MNLKRILVALEYEQDPGPVLQRVRHLLTTMTGGDAEVGQPELHLFIADFSDALERSYLFDEVALGHARDGYMKPRRKWLEKLAQPLQAEGLRVSTHARWEKPRYVAVLDEADRLGADLIVKITHPRSTLGRVFLAPGDWHLIRNARAPLWLVKENLWPTQVRVAACVDPVHEDETDNGRDQRLLSYAHDLAISLPAELHVIHAYDPPPTGLAVEFDAVLGQSDTIRDEVRLHHRKAFDALVEGRVENSVHCHFEEGSPARVIPEVVGREGIDLVVMGAVARSGLERLLIGSTAEQVLDAIDADLLILK